MLAVLAVVLEPPELDAVLGDKPRDLWDFTRMCEVGGSGEPFPRAASYEPGAAPHPWVAVEDGRPAYIGDTKPNYTSPTWDAYADLFAEVDAAPPGPRDRS